MTQVYILAEDRPLHSMPAALSVVSIIANTYGSITGVLRASLEGVRGGFWHFNYGTLALGSFVLVVALLLFFGINFIWLFSLSLSFSLSVWVIPSFSLFLIDYQLCGVYAFSLFFRKFYLKNLGASGVSDD